jgi:hypothetical protein
MTPASLFHGERDFKEALGTAVVELWAELPEIIQQKLFERAVIAGHHSERDESLQQELARYLHEANARTVHSRKS